MIGVICLVAILTFSGLTYAYFTSQSVKGNEEEKVVVLSADYGEITVRYKEGSEKISLEQTDLKESEIEDLEEDEEGKYHSSTLNLSVENSGNIEQDVIIKWKDVINDFCEYASNNSCTNVESDTYVGDEAYKVVGAGVRSVV